MSSWQQALVYLIDMVSSFYIICLMLRFLLQWVKADFYNPVCQGLIKITRFGLHPLRRIIPGLFGLDIAALVLMYGVQVVAIGAEAKIIGLPISHFIMVVALFKLIMTLLQVYFFGILIMALMSWFVQDLYRNPMYVLLHQLNEPLLGPVRKILPPMGGFDLSPLLILILLQVVMIFVRGLI